VIARLSIAIAVVLCVLAAVASARAAQDDAAFTITAPTATYETSSAELAHWARIARRAAGGSITRREARWQAFDLLVGYAWIEAEAAERGITVSAEEVHRSFLKQRRQSFPRLSDFRRFLRSTGQTVADIKERVWLDLLANAIRDHVLAPVAASITDAVVDDYIAEHGHIRRPERRDIRLIQTNDRDDAIAARRALRSGRTWNSVAGEFSIDPETSDRGGRRRGVLKGALPLALDRAVFRAPRRRLGGPVRTHTGFWLFWVSRIAPTRFLPEATSRRIIRTRLVAEAQQAALDRFVADMTARWTSRTTCAEEFRASRRCGNRVPAPRSS
jgi:PPIC-type PPIASE domain